MVAPAAILIMKTNHICTSDALSIGDVSRAWREKSPKIMNIAMVAEAA
jgi:hypothetical protein